MRTIRMDDQIWTVENLGVDTFRNGDRIPEAKSIEDWQEANATGRPTCCYYNNEPPEGTGHGRLYNWYAIGDSRGLAPTGWRVSNHMDWQRLMDSCGGTDAAAEALRSLGFSAEPSGFRGSNGEYSPPGKYAAFWTSTEHLGGRLAWVWTIGKFQIFHDPSDKGFGHSVRLVKE